MDRVSVQGRSRIMRAIRSKNTRPEMTVRRYLHASGLRFRLHRRDLPGRPDIVVVSSRTVIFVHGCFWHQHLGCSAATIPQSNREYWLQKFEKTKIRDECVQAALAEAGWHIEVIWECETRDAELHALVERLQQRKRAHEHCGGFRRRQP